MKLITNKSPQEVQYKDFKHILAIFEKIARLENDFDWADKVTDEMYQYQPFMISTLMGYRIDLTGAELTEVFALYTAIWEYFKTNPKAKAKVITEIQYDRINDHNMRIFAKNDPVDMKVIPVLYGIILERFVKRPVLADMEFHSKAAVMIGTKSMIECFEEIFT